jgi:hypothetical protein
MLVDMLPHMHQQRWADHLLHTVCCTVQGN